MALEKQLMTLRTNLMIRKNFVILLSCIICMSAHARSTQFVPNDLMYQGKPIDSLCFSDVSSNTIALRKCGSKNANYFIKGINSKLQKEGFIGYNWENRGISRGLQGYTYYHFYPAEKSKYWIYTLNNGGGSGDFTNIYLVERKDKETFSIRNITGGDRCNGGIENVKENNNVLSWSVNLTAWDLVKLADKKININAYDDLAACAVCCIGKSYYTIKSGYQPEFHQVKLENLKSTTEMPDQGKYEACFNRIYLNYVSKNAIYLDKEKLNNFIEYFKKTCLTY